MARSQGGQAVSIQLCDNMTDIKWHHRYDTDFEDLLFRYYNHVILAETNITFRISNSSFFENGKLV